MARCRPSRAIALGVLLVVSSLISLAPASPAASATPEGQMPIRMVGASAAYFEGASYVFGGRMDDGSYSDGIYKYDHATGAVTKAATLPRIAGDSGGRQSGSAVVLGAKIYYFGGAALTSAGDLNGDGKPDRVPRAISDIVQFTPATSSAITLTTQLPEGIWGTTSAVVDGKAYIFGGFSFDFSRPDAIARKDTILEFDGSSVRKVAKLPYSVQDASAATFDGRIYIFGGLSDHNPEANPCPKYRVYNETSNQYEDQQPPACLTDLILSFNPKSGIAGIFSNLPFRGQFLNAAVIGSRVYVAGGAVAGPTATSAIIEVDPKAAAPIKIMTPTLPEAIFGAPATSDGVTMTIFGGRLGGYANLTSEIVRFDPRPSAPWAPRSLSATATTTSVSLGWEPPTYDGGSPVTTYRVYRSSDNEPERAVANITGGTLQHKDSTASPGVQYVYRVTAVNVAGESPTGARANLRSETTTPGVIDSLEVFPANGEIFLRWLAPEQTGGTNLSGYRILRNGTLLTSVGPNANQHVDRNLANGVVYSYTIRAYNIKGDGPLSPSISRAPAAVPETPASISATATSDSKVRITWEDPITGAADGFALYKGTEAKHLTRISNLTQREYVDADVQEGRTYYYTVAAFNLQGESPPTEVRSVSLVTPPGPPANLIVAPGPAEIKLTWQTPDDTGKADMSDISYFVSRSEAGAAPRIVATGIKGTTFTDRFVKADVAYTYTVTAMNPLVGTATAPKTATPKPVVNAAPKAILAALPPIAKAGDEIELDASQSSDEDGQIVSYRFAFGDGQPEVTSEHPSVTYRYKDNGTYSASVVAVDNRGATSNVAVVQIVIGHTAGPLPDDATTVPPGRTDGERPGEKTPIPGPTGLLVILGVVAAALIVRGRRAA